MRLLFYISFIFSLNSYSYDLFNTISAAFRIAIDATNEVISKINNISKELTLGISAQKLGELEAELLKIDLEGLLKVCNEKREKGSDCDCNKLESSYNKLKDLIRTLRSFKERIENNELSEKEKPNLLHSIEELTNEAKNILQELEKDFRLFRSSIEKSPINRPNETQLLRIHNSKNLAEDYIRNNPKSLEPKKGEYLIHIGNKLYAPCSDPFGQVKNIYEPNSIINILVKEDDTPVTSRSETGYCKTVFLDDSNNIKIPSFQNKVFGFMLGKKDDSKFITYKSIFIDDRVPLLWIPDGNCDDTTSCGQRCSTCQTDPTNCIKEFELARVSLNNNEALIFHYDVSMNKPKVTLIEIKNMERNIKALRQWLSTNETNHHN